MSKHVATSLINSTFPMWDSFEALFFVIAGLSVGFVFGILFPSIWRSFRRSFRKQSHYAPHSEKWDVSISPKIKILDEEEENSNEKEQGNEPLSLHVFEAFTAARYYFQTGDARKAVSLYIEILTWENVSKGETNRALFELSQVYSFIGLQNRAFDTSFELLNRKPQQSQVLVQLLKILSQNFTAEKLNLVLGVYKGIADPKLRRMIAHSVCRLSEIFLVQNEVPKAIDYARLAVKWDRSSGRALILLWETTSKQFWGKNTNNKKIAWLSFAADLEARTQISLNSEISPAAGAGYLSGLIGELIQLPNSLENYHEVEKEFKATFHWEKFPAHAQKKLLQSIFYAVILLQKNPSTRALCAEVNLNEILSLITNNQQDEIMSFFNESKKQESTLFFGKLAHQCSQCQGIVSQFTWLCPYCGLEETFFPVQPEST